jgi:hypothetical protein
MEVVTMGIEVKHYEMMADAGRRVNEQTAVHVEMKLLLLPGYQA